MGSDTTNLEKLYKRLVTAENHVRAIRKAMVALPKKKKKRYEVILADKLAKMLTARSAFQVEAKKLTPIELALFHQKVYV